MTPPSRCAPASSRADLPRLLSPGIWRRAAPARCSRWTRIRQADGEHGDAGQVRDAGPARVGAKLWEHLRRPFYDNGPNDKGVGIQLAYSIARVALGYLLAALVAIPIGFLIGMSPLFQARSIRSSRC